MHVQSMGNMTYIFLLNKSQRGKKRYIEYEVHNHSAPNAIPLHG